MRAAMGWNRYFKRGMSLTELLCVIAIIGILAAVYLPTLARTFVRVKKFLTGQ